MELCGGRVGVKWEEAAEGPLALMLTDGDSGLGVEEADEVSRAAEVLTPFRPFITGPVGSLVCEKTSRV